jgi:hypothetical protein
MIPSHIVVCAFILSLKGLVLIIRFLRAQEMSFCYAYDRSICCSLESFAPVVSFANEEHHSFVSLKAQRLGCQMASSRLVKIRGKLGPHKSSYISWEFDIQDSPFLPPRYLYVLRSAGAKGYGLHVVLTVDVVLQSHPLLPNRPRSKDSAVTTGNEPKMVEVVGCDDGGGEVTGGVDQGR